MDDFDYTPEQRGRNQVSIVLSTAALLAIVFVSGSLQGWPMSSFVVVGVIVLATAALVWKLFASSSARPLPTSKKHARWPYLSKQKLDDVQGDWKDLGRG